MTNHQDTSTERERFEVWITPKLKAGSHLNKSASGIYLDNRVAAKWSAWQAALASRDEAAQQPQGQVVSDEEIASIVRAVEDKDKVPSFSNGFYTLTPEELSAFTSAILALRDGPTIKDSLTVERVPLSEDWATIAGLESAVYHLSTLVDQQRALLAESEDVFGRDGHGGRYEDGECGLIDRIRAHLEMTAPPPKGITAKEQGNGN